MGMHLLVVDDEQSVQQLFMQFFEEEGFSVAVASDGLEALLKMKERVPDLLITDIVMTGMDGLALLREVKMVYPDLPVIAISGGQRAMSINFQPYAKTDGATEFIEKPVLLTELLQSVQKLLDENPETIKGSSHDG